jgi:PPOX class probable F420-dependent enzyme
MLYCKREVNIMSDVIPKEYRDLFEKKAFANLATIMPDGTPQVTPVWVEAEGNEVLINSSKGRRKDLNMRSRSTVALSMQDPDNPYRYLEVRGTVTEITEEGADVHIDKLAKKYLGVDKYPYRQEGEVRVIYRIKPERTSTYG